MKKTLIAAAVLSLAGSAMAQSSVVIYGIIDAAVTHGAGSGAGATSKTALTSGNTAGSRLGFRGVEDLGGGMSAGFVLEAGLLIDDGEGIATNTNNQNTGAAPAGQVAMMFGRRSTVSLFAPWGEIRLGRDFSSQYRNRVEVDPFANAGIGTIQPQSGSLGGLVSTRATNIIGYHLPDNLGGWYGQAQVYLGENVSGTPDSDSGTGMNFRLGYINKDLNVSVSDSKTSYLASATAGDITSLSVAVQYRIKDVNLMTGWYRDTVTRTLDTLVGEGWTAGGIWTVGPDNIKFAFSRYGQDLGAKPSTDKLSLGVEHSLSKRTLLYATGAQTYNSGGAKVALGGTTTAANETSWAYELGMKHTF